jgi:hypothetical protein
MPNTGIMHELHCILQRTPIHTKILFVCHHCNILARQGLYAHRQPKKHSSKTPVARKDQTILANWSLTMKQAEKHAAVLATMGESEFSPGIKKKKHLVRYLPRVTWLSSAWTRSQ